jgi:hypothetical protein|tara:strand:+ start:1934 stop:2167 length:234 start_codon:yes stop_codon:yes gene_type:complete
MKTNKYPLIMFKVEIILSGKNKGKSMFCLGLDDVHKFTEEQKLEVGIDKYNGYRSQAIPLSCYASNVIKNGVVNTCV